MLRDFKHTPGPWRIVIDGTCSAAWPHILGPDHEDDCVESVAELDASHLEKTVRGFPANYQEKPQRFKPSPNFEVVMANARLIAAAPDLLKALLPFMQFSSSEETVKVTLKTKDVEFARDVVARAMGDL